MFRKKGDRELITFLFELKATINGKQNKTK